MWYYISVLRGKAREDATHYAGRAKDAPKPDVRANQSHLPLRTASSLSSCASSKKMSASYKKVLTSYRGYDIIRV